jgi:type I restriction enzyme S subunit
MFRDLRPYTAYAASPGRWIPAMPPHWRIARGAGVLHPVKERNTHLLEETVLSLSYGRVVVKPADKIRGLVPDSFGTYQILEPGDIVVRPTDLQNDQTSLRVGQVKNHGMITSAYLGLRPTGINEVFACLYLAALDHMKIFYGMGSGLRQNLDLGDFKRLPMPLPSAEEQAAIVKYLGHARARIDRAIAAKREVIGLLEEQKQAVINQAVTRGLNPTVPMKDSGIPWLGQIPSHWEAPALRRYWQAIDCKHLTVPFTPSGYPLASVVQSQRFFLDLSDAKRTDEASYRSLIEGERRPRPRDLIYCRNVGVGKAAVVQTDEPFALGQDVTILRSRTQEPVFLNHFLQSPPMARQLERVLVGSTFRRINVEQIRALVIVVPPVDEQRTIVAAIKNGTGVPVAAQSRAHREIELLREFRTRLTSDVVTGQVDVREIAATLPEFVEPSETDADNVDDELLDDDATDELDALLEEADA